MSNNVNNATITVIRHTDVYQRTQYYLKVKGEYGEILLNIRETEMIKINSTLTAPSPKLIIDEPETSPKPKTNGK